MSAGRIEAVRNEPLYAEMAHVGEGHWVAERLTHSITSSARAVQDQGLGEMAEYLGI
jgi:hypothetical protein